MADRKTRTILGRLDGGRNGADPPMALADHEVVDAVNVDWYRTTGARKRCGSTQLAMNGFASGFIIWMGRHVPGITEADAEFWAMDNSLPVNILRLDNSAAWIGIGVITGGPGFGFGRPEFTCASLNGLFFITWNDIGASYGIPRLHVFDSTMNEIRPTGIYPGTVASNVTDTGAGAYAQTLRYYRGRFYTTFGGATTRMSEPWPSVSWTPGPGVAAARVFRPTLPSDERGVTAWQLEASTDNVTFYVIGNVSLATTFIDDTLDPTTYANGTLDVSPLTGTFALQKAYRFIAADQSRIIGFGNYDIAALQNRIEYSATVAEGLGAVERVDQSVNYFYDLDENDSGEATALVGPVWGNFYAFKSRQWWELAPTGSLDSPYRVTAITKTLGCVGPHAACIGEDAQGRPCIYAMTHRGVYRYGAGGLTYIGRGIEDLLHGPTSVMNMQAANVIAHLVYHPDRRQLWCWFATGTQSQPNNLCVFDILADTGGGAWTRYTGPIANAYCSLMFADSIGTTMGYTLVPYIGYATAPAQILKADAQTATSDAGIPFQASITTKPIEPAPGFSSEVGDAMMLAPAAAGVSLQVTVTPDFGKDPSKIGLADLTPVGSETRVIVPAVDTTLTDGQFYQYTVGDAAPSIAAWSFDRILVPLEKVEAQTR